MSGRRRSLGRGLDALLGAQPAPTPSGEAEANAITELPLASLIPNRQQPRTRFDESGLEELSNSIRTQGVIQPLVITPAADGRYTIVAGERRWRAATAAGLERVPVVIREVADDRQLLELALVENLQRQDLDPIEEAEAYQALAEEFGQSHEAIGKQVGKSRPAIANSLRLLRLPVVVRDWIRDGQLTAGQARPLLALGDPERQIALAEQAIREKLTARDLERMCASQAPRSAPKASDPPTTDPNTRAAIERLTRQLQTKVDIARRRRGGQIRIHFHSEDELIRLYDALTQAKGDD